MRVLLVASCLALTSLADVQELKTKEHGEQGMEEEKIFSEGKYNRGESAEGHDNRNLKRSMATQEFDMDNVDKKTILNLERYNMRNKRTAENDDTKKLEERILIEEEYEQIGRKAESSENSFKNFEKRTYVEEIVKPFNESQEKVTETYMQELAENITTTEIYDTKQFQRRSSLNDDERFFEHQQRVQRRTSPAVDRKMARKLHQENKIKRLLEEQNNNKKMQRRTFDMWGFLGLGGEQKQEETVQITKEVPVPIPYPVEKKIPFPVKVEVEHMMPVQVSKPYPVTVEKKIYYPVKEYVRTLYPVYKKVPYMVKIPVEKPIAVHISKPYPVYIEKNVPYMVEKQVPYPVKIPVDRPYPVHVPVVKNIYYPVEKKVPYPVPMVIEKPVAVSVEKPYPVYIENTPPEEHGHNQGHRNYDFQRRNVGSQGLNIEYGFVPVEKHNTEHIASTRHESQDNKEDRFVPVVVNPIKDDRNHVKLQKKKDGEEKEPILQESRKEEKFEKDTSTTQQPKEENKPNQKNEKEKDEFKKKEGTQVFGKKI